MLVRFADPAHCFGFAIKNPGPDTSLGRRDLGMPIAVQRFMRQRHESDPEPRRNPELRKRNDRIARGKMKHGIAGSGADDQSASELVFQRENGERLITLQDLIVSPAADVGAYAVPFVDDRAR
jgi:hypothetical protein